MEAKKFMAFLVTTFVLSVLALSNASAFANITHVHIDNAGGYMNGNRVAGVFAGEDVQIRVIFTALDDATDVRATARLLGENGFEVETERFDLVKGSSYSRTFRLNIPLDVDPNERLILYVNVEGSEGIGDSVEIPLEVQRNNYQLEIVSVDSENEVKAGESLGVDVVLKNRGRHESEDTFVVVSIPELGISKKTYFEDLSAVDQNDPERYDSANGRVYLNIPSVVNAGIYTLKVEAYNADTTVTTTRNLVILGTEEKSKVVSSSHSKTFAVGEEEAYTLTLVNAGSQIVIYDLVVDGAEALDFGLDDSIVVVPAGGSKTVKLLVSASEEGKYDFAVNVHSDGAVIDTVGFTANVEGKSFSGNTAILLTVVLAIIFIVLLIVLIVLLTRKPANKEDFGESYY